MKTLVVANEKGGVGKSTLTAHLAYAALGAHMRVLLVDMDRQGSLGLSFPPQYAAGTLTASKLYGESIEGLTPEKVTDHLDIARADAHLLDVDLHGVTVVGNPKKALDTLASDYDVCLIDTPPTLGPRLIASLVAADFVVTPVSMGLYEIAGVNELISTIQATRKRFNRKLRYLGILPMKTNTRSKAETAQLQALKLQVGDAMLPTHLPERAAVRNAVLAGIPVWEQVRGETHGKAANEWRAACALLLSKVMAES